MEKHSASHPQVLWRQVCTQTWVDMPWNEWLLSHAGLMHTDSFFFPKLALKGNIKGKIRYHKSVFRYHTLLPSSNVAATPKAQKLWAVTKLIITKRILNWFSISCFYTVFLWPDGSETILFPLQVIYAKHLMSFCKSQGWLHSSYIGFHINFIL